MAKLAEVSVGQVWTVKISGRVVNARVESIDKVTPYNGKSKTVLTLLNLMTRNKVTRSAAALRDKKIEGVS